MYRLDDDRVYHWVAPLYTGTMDFHHLCFRSENQQFPTQHLLKLLVQKMLSLSKQRVYSLSLLHDFLFEWLRNVALKRYRVDSFLKNEFQELASALPTSGEIPG